MSSRFQKPAPHHSLGPRRLHPGGAGGAREELEREEGHRVTAAAARPPRGLRVQLEGFVRRTKGTGFAASNFSSFSLPCGPDTAGAVVIFLQMRAYLGRKRANTARLLTDSFLENGNPLVALRFSSASLLSCWGGAGWCSGSPDARTSVDSGPPSPSAPRVLLPVSGSQLDWQ